MTSNFLLIANKSFDTNSGHCFNHPDPLLAGEKLDIKQCETLEEVFRRVQFETLDIEATHLDDEVRSDAFPQPLGREG